MRSPCRHLVSLTWAKNSCHSHGRDHFARFFGIALVAGETQRSVSPTYLYVGAYYDDSRYPLAATYHIGPRLSDGRGPSLSSVPSGATRRSDRGRTGVNSAELLASRSTVDALLRPTSMTNLLPLEVFFRCLPFAGACWRTDSRGEADLRRRVSD